MQDNRVAIKLFQRLSFFDDGENRVAGSDHMLQFRRSAQSDLYGITRFSVLAFRAARSQNLRQRSGWKALCCLWD